MTSHLPVLSGDEGAPTVHMQLPTPTHGFAQPHNIAITSKKASGNMRRAPGSTLGTRESVVDKVHVYLPKQDLLISHA